MNHYDEICSKIEELKISLRDNVNLTDEEIILLKSRLEVLNTEFQSLLGKRFEND